MKLSKNNTIIDRKVYIEVIIKGKDNGYPDADIAEKYLIEYKIPIIPTDIEKFIQYFHDPGETSCFILAKDHGTCITTDKKAFNKFKLNKVETMRLDTFFYNAFKKNKLTRKELSNTLKIFLRIHATTPERYASIMDSITKKAEKI